MSKSQQQILITIDDSNLAQHTKNDYNYRLAKFFEKSTVKSIEKLIKIPSEKLQYELVKYTQFLVKRVKNEEISPNSVPKYFKGIKYVLDVNYRENDIKWKPIRALFPTRVRASGYKSWTTEQVSEMEKYCKTTRNLAFLHFMASIGGRIGIHEESLLVKHLVPMSSIHNDSKPDCYAVLLYAAFDESAQEKDSRELEADSVQSGDSYWSFLTPEATKYLKRYHDQRIRSGEVFDDNTPIFRTQFQTKYANQNITQLSRSGAISLMNRILANTSLSRVKKGRRYDVQLDHGFRKRFNTILKLENSVNSNIAEKIMGHKNGLDGVYFTPTREQCFAEFIKAIPELTISPEERQKIEIQIKQKRITELELKEQEINSLQEEITKLKSNQDQIIKRANTPTITIEDLKEPLKQLFKENPQLLQAT